MSKYRDGDLDDFFSHENHPWPPSISENGKLCLPTKKSDLLCLDGPAVESPVNVHVKIFDCPAIVHSLNNKQVTTFDEYGDNLGQISSFTSVIGLTSFGIDMYLVVSKNQPERRGGKVSEERCKPKQSYQLIIQTFLEIHQTKQNCLNFNGYVGFT